MKNNKKATTNKFLSLGFSLALLFVALITFFVPIIFTDDFSLSPFKLMVSKVIEDIDFGGYEPLKISYLSYKYFYYIFALITSSSLFLIIYYFLTNDKKFAQYSSNIMKVNLLFLIIHALVGFNYINVYSAIGTVGIISTFSYIFAVIGTILIIVKAVLNIILGESLKEEVKETNHYLFNVFIQGFLTLGALFAPLYMFTGTKYRLLGIDLLLGKENVLSFMSMTSVYKVVLIIFIIFAIISFISNIIISAIKKKVFVFYYKINSFLTIVFLVSYAFMGLNYFLAYIDGKGFNTYFDNGLTTYSYIPLALLLFFKLGFILAQIASSKIHLEYKVYATPTSANEMPATPVAPSAPAKEMMAPKIKPEEEKKTINPDTNTSAPLAESKDDISPRDPIPAFSELDKQLQLFHTILQERKSRINANLTLPVLVNHIIEYARCSPEKLSYGPLEIKTFIAGLAASRLSILQGMSGTGKTSLPKIFAEAIDGYCDLVAVESSWRDKNELLGYYNEFSKKYTPKSFTQFLYKAALNPEIPYFIVLDEMNLSRIEYYFSDFLSLMESRENKRFIKLVDIQLYPQIDARKKYFALRDGHTIDIPANLWFIGTANRDESTFEISDKVYDRAQTMNFDKRAPKVVNQDQITCPKIFVPYKQLLQLMNNAKEMIFDAERYDTIKKVETLLIPYKLSFGNRILKQMEEFVKVFVSCSQITTESDRERFIHEAVDCILLSKVVRKLEFRQVDIDNLIEEFSSLNLSKCVQFLQTLVDSF